MAMVLLLRVISCCIKWPHFSVHLVPLVLTCPLRLVPRSSQLHLQVLLIQSTLKLPAWSPALLHHLTTTLASLPTVTTASNLINSQDEKEVQKIFTRCLLP